MSYSRSGRGFSKPPSGSQIDWGHPLSQNLVSALLCSEGAGPLSDLARISRVSSTTIPVWSSQSKGRVARDWAFPTAGSEGLTFQKLMGWTAATFVRVTGTITGQNFIPVRFSNYVSESNNQGWFFQLSGSNPRKWDAGSFNNNGFANYSIVGTTTVVEGEWFIVQTSDRTTRRLFVNGIQDASGTTNPIPAVNTAGTYNNTTLTAGINAWTYAVYCWDRCLNPLEITRLYTEPYAMIRHVTHRRYFVEAAAADVYSGRGVGRGLSRGVYR